MSSASSMVVFVNQAELLPVSEELIVRAVVTVLDAASVPGCEVSVTFLKDRQIRELNDRFLGHDWATDVLSFSLDPDHESPKGTVTGEMYIGAERARAQAIECGMTPEVEAVRLAVHGTLHLLGHDHPEEGREASPFFVRQEELVQQIVPEAAL